MQNINIPSNLKDIVPSATLTDASRPPDAFKSKVAKPIKTIKEPVPRYFESINQINGYWSEGEYDLMEIFKLLKFESYFFKATQKKQGLLTKSGFEVHSDNDQIKEYLNARFSMMELQTNVSINRIIQQLAFYLIVCSNAFLIKVRDKDFKYASSYVRNNKEMQPVAGLFLVHPTSLKARYKWVKFPDGNQVKHKLELDAWVYVNKRGAIVDFDPDDVVHFTLYKEDGMTLGTPEVVSVIDDIRTLRKMEEDVQLLLYRDLFPILHYSIENPSMVDHTSGITEIDQAKHDLERMMQDGGIATDGRHKINYIGAQGKHIEVRPYLEYFQNRVFSGLGVSATDMGIGADVSGTTASDMSKQLLDSARFVQQELTRQFDESILTEMILQSPFGIAGLKKGERPSLRFEEIDIEWKIRTENHAADQFTKGAVTIDEMRNDRGLKTLSDEHLKRTHSHLYGDQNPAALKEREAKVNKLQTSAKKDLLKTTKTNSNVVKSKRTKVRDSADFIIGKDISLLLLDTIDRYKDEHPIGRGFNIKLETQSIYLQIKQNIITKFNDGMTDAADDLEVPVDYSKIDVSKLIDSIMSSVDQLADAVSKELVSDITKNTPKSIRRIDLANRTEQVKAYNIGYASVAKSNGIVMFDTFHYDNSEKIDTITIESVDDVMPKHPNSKTIIKISKVKDEIIRTLPGFNDAVSKMIEHNNAKFVTIEDQAIVVNLLIEEQAQAVKDNILSLEDKLSDALNYIKDLNATVTLLKAELADNDKEDTSDILDKINANTNEQIKMFLETIGDLKDQNHSISAKYLNTIEKIMKGMDSLSKDNMESIMAIADASPKTITVHTSPVDVKVDNPPMDINFSMNEAPKTKVSKNVNVIRDDLGNIISATIEEG
jgi:hypothetical protein